MILKITKIWGRADFKEILLSFTGKVLETLGINLGKYNLVTYKFI